MNVDIYTDERSELVTNSTSGADAIKKFTPCFGITYLGFYTPR